MGVMIPLFGAPAPPDSSPEPSKPNSGAKATTSSAMQEGSGDRATDGDATEGAAWLSAGGESGQWLQLDYPAAVKVSEIQVHGGSRTLKDSLIGSGEIQVKDGEAWKKIAEFSGNRREELRVSIPDGPVTASSLRLWTPQQGPVAIREFAVYPQPAAMGEGLTFYRESKHLVCVNQLAYNDGYPKRFTVPTAPDEELHFTVNPKGSGEVVYSGKVMKGIGDFSAWHPRPEGGDYVIRVEGGSKEASESYPFEVGPGVLQRSLLQPMVDFMIDARSVVGTHPSAYGGAAWRDGSYYTHELASLVMLYLAFPEEIERMPRQIDWKAERTRVLDPGFSFTQTHMDGGFLQATRTYYTHFESPADDAPDVVKLIHWGLGMTLAKPQLMDPSGDGIGMRIHPQHIEQIAYVLALQPRLEKWLPKSLFEEAEDFASREWLATQLLEVQPEWSPQLYRPEGDPNLHLMGGTAATPYKGRHAPGHSILPNLLMYEACRKSGNGRADLYLMAAARQAEFVVKIMDWSDPRHTKGHRMSEHKTITGLVWLQQNYPKYAPEGLKRKLEQWADVAIARSDNLWDFRRYDLGDHWSIPKMNEPGNLGGFPACALSVSWLIEDPVKKQRLREIAYASLDCLFGRNPVNSASPHRPEMGWGGKIEQGWPVGFKKGTSAWLEICRGSLSSSPGSEMFPFNPRGKPRHPEGWGAFNAALNVGMAYLEFDSQSRAGLPPDCLKQENQ